MNRTIEIKSIEQVVHEIGIAASFQEGEGAKEMESKCHKKLSNGLGSFWKDRLKRGNTFYDPDREVLVLYAERNWQRMPHSDNEYAWLDDIEKVINQHRPHHNMNVEKVFTDDTPCISRRT